VVVSRCINDLEVARWTRGRLNDIGRVGHTRVRLPLATTIIGTGGENVVMLSGCGLEVKSGITHFRVQVLYQIYYQVQLSWRRYTIRYDMIFFTLLALIS